MLSCNLSGPFRCSWATRLTAVCWVELGDQMTPFSFIVAISRATSPRKVLPSAGVSLGAARLSVARTCSADASFWVQWEGRDHTRHAHGSAQNLSGGLKVRRHPHLRKVPLTFRRQLSWQTDIGDTTCHETGHLAARTDSLRRLSGPSETAPSLSGRGLLTAVCVAGVLSEALQVHEEACGLHADLQACHLPRCR